MSDGCQNYDKGQEPPRPEKHSSGSLKRGVKPLVVCHHCQGSGKIKLSTDMQLTLDAVKFLGKATAPEVSTAVLWSGEPTAINNRLTDLMAHGLVERTRVGRTYVWSAV